MASETFHFLENQKEETENTLGVFVKKKTLFHGRGRDDLEGFREAEEDTVGKGMYFTSRKEDAYGYAKRRARIDKEALTTVYESVIENAKLIDLRKKVIVEQILHGFRGLILKELKKQELLVFQQNLLLSTLERIDTGTVGPDNIRDVTFGLGSAFRDYVRELGYDGVIALEGGEGEDVGRHDSYVIFNPSVIRKIEKTT